MDAGCCSLLRPKSKKPKSSSKSAIQISEKEISLPNALISTDQTNAIASTSRITAFNKEELSAGVQPPTAGAYAFEAGKQTVELLQRFANALPIPCANEVLEVALLLMNTYEASSTAKAPGFKDVTILEEQVKELNNRIGSLMLVMVDGLSGKDANLISAEVVRDIERLGGDLRAIQKDLTKITSQSRWLLIFFKNANKDTVDACLGRLNDALQSFNVSRAIRDGNMLFEIQTRLESVNKVTGQMAEQVNQMYTWLLDKDAHNGQSSLVLEEMPVLVHLYGRDGVIKQIAQILTTKPRPRVGILGAGGMGKTSVAVAVMEDELVGQKYKDSHRFWIPCVGVTSPITFLQILSKSLRVNQDTGAPLKDILHTLKSTKEPRLILLDNLETAMSLPEIVADGGRLSAESVIDQLASIPHVSILVTIRSNTLPSDAIAWDLIHLEGVAREDARSIFTSVCPSAADHPSLDALLDALGYMPYAVMLMAKQAVKSFVEPDELLEEWKKSGTNSLSGDLKLKMNRSIGFSVESKAILENPNAQLLLAILSKLPSGTNQKHLKWWAKTIEHVPSAIATLNDTALITQRREGVPSPTFFVLPVVQSYLHEQPLYNSPMTRRLVIEACCRFVLDHKSSPGDENFKVHLQELDIEKTNIQSLLLGVTPESLSELGLAQNIANLFEAMVAFAWYQFWTKRSPELLTHLLEIAPTSEGGGDEGIRRYVAEAQFCLGRTYIKLGRYKEASEVLKSARAKFQGLDTPADIVRAGDSALYLATTLSFLLGSGYEIERLIREAQKDFENDPKGSARALMHLGYNYWYNCMPERGLEQLEEARKSLETLGCTVDAAECIFYMTRCYGQLGSLPEWMEKGQEMLRFSRLVGMNDLIAQALRGLSRCYIRMKRYTDALVTLQEGLAISEKLGHPLAIAQVYELSGYAYAMNGDLYGARLAYEGAKKVYSDMEETEQTRMCLRACTYNLQRIEDARDGEGDLGLTPPMLT
ncbi:hypothetical protein FRC17_005655 [Serendipita sp. 399]|nr:hypothetical protein FRC17_005655 [Serendipita sp. 399]